MIIAVTGHRPDKLGNEWDMKGPISKKIYQTLAVKIEELKPKKVITGMSLGVDMIFANLAINKKIPFIAAVPFEGQEKKWPERSQILYNNMLEYAERVEIICNGGYAAWKMQKRNEWMVDNCDVLIAVWNGTEGGTFNCITYAVDREVPIVRLKPYSTYS